MTLENSIAARRRPGMLVSMVRHGLGAALSAALLGAALLDCNLVLGTGSYAVGTTCPAGDCVCGGFEYASSDCQSCSEASCCTESDTCQGNGPCATLYDCLTACAPADAACRNACTTKTPVENTAPAAALESCRAASCAGKCTTCGTLADWRSDSCPACVASSCCEAASACAADETCAALQRCYRACTDPGCPQRCDASMPGVSASTKAAALASCVDVTCAKACSYGGQWSCVGAFQWPAKGSTPVKYTVNATSFADGSPFTDVLVKACNRSDLDCANPITSGTTLQDGTITLTVPSGFAGYLDLTQSAIADSLVYLSWPITTDTSVNVQVGSYQLYASLVAAGGGSANPAEGALFVYTRDCLGDPAPGVHLDIMSETPAADTAHFYFEGGSPVATLQATTTDAIGGFSNIAQGNVTLDATLQANHQAVASFISYVRPKAITFVTLTPTPTP